MVTSALQKIKQSRNKNNIQEKEKKYNNLIKNKMSIVIDKNKLK